MWAITLGTAAIPVLILLSTKYTSVWVGKFSPALIAAALFVTASYTQLERPHQRWEVYRRYQRTFEAERVLYQNGAEPYSDPATRDALFSTRVAELTVALHQAWSGVLPTPDEVARITSRGAG